MPLFWLSLAFLLGLVAGSASGFSSAWPIWVILAIAVWALGILLQSQFPYLIKNTIQAIRIRPIILLAAFFLGAGRYQLGDSSLAPNNLARYNDSGPVEVIGWVASDLDKLETTSRFQFVVSQIKKPGDQAGAEVHKPRGRLLVQLSTSPDYHYGDVLQLTGEMLTPDEGNDFLYREYLASRDILAIMDNPSVTPLEISARRPWMRSLFDFRHTAYQNLRQLLPIPESALLGGILLGLEADIPPLVEKAFEDTGTSHIIVISGSNISLLAVVLAFFFGKIFNLRWSLLLTITGVFTYACLVGGDPPVFRAAVMGLLGGLASLLGRRQTGLNSLAFSAALMCIFEPLLLWSASFQLSFGATAGMLLLGSPLMKVYEQTAQKYLSSETTARLAGPISEYVLLTLAAQIGVFPIAAFHFHRISISSFLANLLILPAQPPIMALGGLTLAASFLFEPLAKIIAWLVWVPLTYTIRIVETIASIWPGVWTITELPVWAVAVVYLCALVLLVPALQPVLKKLYIAFRERVRLNIAIIVLLFANLLVWHAGLHRLDRRLRITTLNEGSAILVQTPQGRNLLINGASSANRLGQALDKHLGLFHKDLDYLILTGHAPSTLTGLIGIQDRYQPDQVLIHSQIPESSALTRLQSSWSKKGIDIHQIETQQSLSLDQDADAALYILLETDTGVATQITWDRFCALIPGGVDPHLILNHTNTCLLKERSVIILTPPDLTNQDWVEAWFAQMPGAVIAYDNSLIGGADDRFSMVRTWQAGWLTIATDGRQYWLSSQR
jgi:competence protein ComEC